MSGLAGESTAGTSACGPGASTEALRRPAPSWTAWSGYPWVVLIAAVLVQTSASFGNQAISPLAPFLLRDLGINRFQIGLLVTATYIGALFVLIPAGGLSDRVGVRRLFLVGPTAAGLTLALGGLVPNYVWLFVPLGLYGIGNGLSLPPTTRAIVEWFPPRRAGLPMGIKQTGVALAGVILGIVVAPLATDFDWRGALVALGLLTAAAGVTAWLLYRDRVGEARVDTSVPRSGLGAIVSNPGLLLLGGVTWIYAGVQLSLVGFLVLFLKERFGLNNRDAGALFSLAQAGGVIGRIGWGLFSDALLAGRRKPVMGVIGLLAASTAVGLSLLNGTTPMPVLVALLFVAGLSAIGWNGINMTFVAEIAGRRASATAAGFNLTASYLGILTFPPIFGALVDASGGSYTAAFQVGAAAYGLALLLLWRIPTR
jgi:MFS transporter, ACS family, hexuronate transporter